MDLLVLGGTVFLGRTLVELALRDGHVVTLFNRDKSNPELFQDVEKIQGDRGEELSALAGRRWDAVIDTCGYLPRVVRKSAQTLAGVVDHYTFISSISVYADSSQPGVDESAPTGKLADETVEEITGDTYGPLKAVCEGAVESAFPARSLVVRPGLIVGPHDPTDRFTYWPWRVMQGGEVLAPGRPDRPIQFIDVRDLANWIIRAIEARLVGVYNTVSPPNAITMGSLLATTREVSQSDTRFTWVSEEYLLEQDVASWSEMPLWVPESNPEYAGFFAFESRKAMEAGLQFRPVRDTLQATIEWALTRPIAHQWRAGITRAREVELLQIWSGRVG